MSRGHYVYIVRCADGTLYTGYARDPQRRVDAHNAGRGAKYTAGRRPVALVYSERFRSLGAALRRELELKRLRRARKERLLSAAAITPAAPRGSAAGAPPARTPAPPPRCAPRR